MVRLWGLFTLTRRRNILATYLSYIRRNVNQYSITTTYDLIIQWHENANLDIKQNPMGLKFGKENLLCSGGKRGMRVPVLFLSLYNKNYVSTSIYLKS